MALPRLYENLDDYDPSLKAARQLNSILKTDVPPEDLVVLDGAVPPKHKGPNEAFEKSNPTTRTASADAVRSGSRLIQNTKERSTVRLLIVTKNKGMRALGSVAQKRLVELSKIFGEIHVVILNEFTEATVSTVRLTDNVWLYSTDSDKWWKMGFDAYRKMDRELIFAGTFRADIIVAEDPFEAGAVGYALARKYERPFEVHVLEDIYSPEFEDADPHNSFRSFVAPFILRRADCVRVTTENLKEEIAHEFPSLAPFTEVLPRYYNLAAWRDSVPTFNLHERYPRFNFIMLHVSNMESSSHTKEVIQGVAPLLRTYPTIGLVIVGNGPYRPALEKQVISLGIQSQVEFEPVPDEIISHMKSAQLLIQLGENSGEDVILLKAAAVGLPILAQASEFSKALFVDNESAYLCEGSDPSCVSHKVKLFLNDNIVRKSFAQKAQESVFDRVEQDYDAYLDAYRSSVERCVRGATQVA